MGNRERVGDGGGLGADEPNRGDPAIVREPRARHRDKSEYAELLKTLHAKRGSWYLEATWRGRVWIVEPYPLTAEADPAVGVAEDDVATVGVAEDAAGGPAEGRNAAAGDWLETVMSRINGTREAHRMFSAAGLVAMQDRLRCQGYDVKATRVGDAHHIYAHRVSNADGLTDVRIPPPPVDEWSEDTAYRSVTAEFCEVETTLATNAQARFVEWLTRELVKAYRDGRSTFEFDADHAGETVVVVMPGGHEVLARVGITFVINRFASAGWVAKYYASETWPEGKRTEAPCLRTRSRGTYRLTKRVDRAP